MQIDIENGVEKFVQIRGKKEDPSQNGVERPRLCARLNACLRVII